MDTGPRNRENVAEKIAFWHGRWRLRSTPTADFQPYWLAFCAIRATARRDAAGG